MEDTVAKKYRAMVPLHLASRRLGDQNDFHMKAKYIPVRMMPKTPKYRIMIT